MRSRARRWGSVVSVLAVAVVATAWELLAAACTPSGSDGGDTDQTGAAPDTLGDSSSSGAPAGPRDAEATTDGSSSAALPAADSVPTFSSSSASAPPQDTAPAATRPASPKPVALPPTRRWDQLPAE